MNQSRLNTPARLSGHWLWGSAQALAAAPHQFMATAASPFNGLVSIRVLHKRIIAVNDANIVRHIMVTHHQRYRRSYHYDNPVLGQGLLSTDGPSGKTPPTSAACVSARNHVAFSAYGQRHGG